MQRLFLSILFNLLFLAGAQSQTYTIEDLRALERSKSYEEFLIHAKDIRPSQRDKHWKEMLLHMATAHIQQKVQKKQFSRQDYQFIEDLFNWPSLRSDTYFSQLRTDYGITYLKLCFQKVTNHLQEGCEALAKKFWHNSTDKVRAGSAVGTLFANYSSHDEDLWPYFAPAVQSPFSQYYCAQKPIMTTLLHKLTLEIDFEFEPKQTKDKLAQMVNDNCFQEILPELKHTLLSQDQSMATMAFQVLRIKKKLSQVDKDLFLTKYLLTVYSPGELYNMAWNNLVKLSQSHGRRIKTVNKLKQLDPLPGKVFSTRDAQKRKILSKFLSSHMPEYFDHYARTCLDYYEGTKSFPYGIPATHCDDFFELAKKYSLQGQELHLRYSALKK